MMDFSVLLSVYDKENPNYLRQSLDSVFSQTVRAAQVVLVEDGPLTPELDSLLEEYKRKYPELELVPLSENKGLGPALAEGMLHCRYELVARMDTDDIARQDRFEKQLEAFKENPALDVCGSHILEFEDEVDHIVTQRKVPLTDAEIKEYQKKRDGLNHVTVMFKKAAVLKAGNYPSCPSMEDSLLWVNMFKNGATAMNIDDYLVYVRIGKEMFDRRGGWAYYKKYKQARKRVYDTGYISWWDYEYTLLVQLAVALMPNKLRGFVFKRLLHR
jgi:glycosyltransferase involved in cell wall biosynthesis